MIKRKRKTKQLRKLYPVSPVFKSHWGRTVAHLDFSGIEKRVMAYYSRGL